MSMKLLWYVTNNWILTQLKTKISFRGQLPSTLKKEKKWSDIPEHYRNKYNKNELHFYLKSGTELHILNKLTHLIFVWALKSSLFFITYPCRWKKLIFKSKQVTERFRAEISGLSDWIVLDLLLPNIRV